MKSDAPSDRPPVDRPPTLPPRALRLSGLGVGPGICVGTVHLHEIGSVPVPEYKIPAARVEDECARLAEAAEQGSRQLGMLRGRARELPGGAGEELGYLLDAYQNMLKGSRLLRGVESRIINEKINAEAAIRNEMDAMADVFSAMQDSYLASRIEDVKDVGWRLIRVLTKAAYRPFTLLPRNAVIVAGELSPADTALLDPKQVAGMALSSGGADSHTAIMARSLGLPAVLAIADLMRHVHSGDIICLDGRTGEVVIDPDRETLADFRKRRADFLRGRRNLGRLRDLPAETRDGARVRLMANVELPAEVESARQSGAEGIGLLRSEFMFMNRTVLPDEEEQYHFLRGMVAGMAGRPVTVRTLDVGGDKLSDALGLRDCANPALGLRAIRLSLSRPELLEIQLAAILRAGVHGPVRILLPMISTVEELDAVREIHAKVVARLRQRGVPLPDPLPPLGVMIEVPGAALSADALAWRCDFFAIGTNDLTQYTLAIDRSDESVAHLYNPLHPAVLRLIQFTVEAAERAGIPVSVCGEMAGDPRLAAVLVGLGVTELSMSAANIPPVKQNIRRLSMIDVARQIQAIMAINDAPRIAALADALLIESDRVSEKLA
ncbi:phosphoenolpyruvate--protein phosphotransferase [Rhodospirillum rubrum]|uniref:phosphoenolpyruvate--protein phosphotransferase n=1 Tax=Rhodospirillum rubrum TaxID=1085 RepID=UPI00190511B2|nr:phosphoenolpyruvate--protein phosphotransferase [Rhodospirillum rubrum]MBK1666157.1 phosphoenolpyruvate--protein phosphotransferase [Rhodospirillum rubrum]MBK1678268.1 phosphoenolpyruvate--protein phosphotransferase [Rhodospirillum rubrum]